ncbi:putative carboxypeptidase precursor [Zopfochytrium polystomum]|nr:putative carboxypeptidase precursor [Zopfochytrium polystomum]
MAKHSNSRGLRRRRLAAALAAGAVLVGIAVPAAVSAAPAASYNKLFSCAIATPEHAHTLASLHLDVWTHRIQPNAAADVRVKSLAEAARLRTALPNLCTIKNHDVYADAATPEDAALAANTLVNAATDTFFNSYQTYDNIVAKLKTLSTTYPGLTTYTASIGTTIEGRAIPSLIVTDNSVAATNKKMIWWNGGQHAREWISPAVVMYITTKLLSNANAEPYATWLKTTQFVITPINNPDGYAYTFTGDRLWRKNRRNNGDGTYGVDLNRNWDEHWGYVGASTDTSDETYQGTAAFSEPESKAMSNYILSFSNRLSGIDFHSYSQLVLRSWGWTSTPSKNEAVLKKLGDGMASAIKTNSGKSYTSEPGAGLYPASGCTDDWMTAKAKMSGWTIELRDTGSYGFKLPASQIVPTGDEIWAAMNFYVPFVLNNTIPYNTPPSS